MTIHLFGIRHHGPGCARSLIAALDELQPDIIAMEGPADAQEALSHATHEQMVPPVSLLIYPTADPRRSAYFPFARFSPEWQGLQWAAERQVPVRLMDLPQSICLGIEDQETDKPDGASTMDELPDSPASSGVRGEGATDEDETNMRVEEESSDSLTWRVDPIAQLAEAAGYRDHELWWEEQVEQRQNASGLFAAIFEAMQTVREEFPEASDRDLLREAHMRTVIRAIQKEGHAKIAVICGAWHVPVLDDQALNGKRPGCKVSEDAVRLRGLTKVKTSATWIPWTHSRLTYRSGYGAGVRSPGWYDHLWISSDSAPIRWITTAARLLREKDLDASSASVIEAYRLAEALAAIRELRSPGLAELTESILTVLCHGQPTPLQLIHDRLEIGDVLGRVPDDTPAVPLAQDLAKRQKSLRLKISTMILSIDLDVRKEIDIARSFLFHRLELLGISWGTLQRSGGMSSTFHEVWQVEWKPEFAVAVIEASVWGNTVEAAAAAKIVDQASKSTLLPDVCKRLNQAVLAGLADVIAPLLSHIQSIAAVGTDIRHLMDAMLPLAQLARYGDVRGTPSSHVVPIILGMFERILVGLEMACSALDEEATREMMSSIDRVSQSIDLLQRDDLQADWRQTLQRLMDGRVHPMLRGRCCRFLLEKGELNEEMLYRKARLELSLVNPPAESAAWATGLLTGNGLVLLHQDEMWRVFDRWLAELPPDVFVEMLPLLRRAFADFTQPERRQMGEKVRRLKSETGSGAPHVDQSNAVPQINQTRARKVLPVLAHLLGVPSE